MLVIFKKYKKLKEIFFSNIFFLCIQIAISQAFIKLEFHFFQRYTSSSFDKIIKLQLSVNHGNKITQYLKIQKEFNIANFLTDRHHKDATLNIITGVTLLAERTVFILVSHILIFRRTRRTICDDSGYGTILSNRFISLAVLLAQPSLVITSYTHWTSS